MSTYQKLVVRLLIAILWRLVNKDYHNEQDDQKHRELIEEGRNTL